MILPERPDLPGWTDLPFWDTHWPALRARLAAETRAIAPPAPRVFAALEAVRPDDTRVILLGQDPYPTPGHADGLAFSMRPGAPISRSMSNIFKEMENDLHVRPPSGDLTHLARQGVLMLNTALTVPEGQTNGHARIGWAPLIDDILARLDDRPRALLLWGKAAQARAAIMRHPDHLRIETAHPSPLSARRGFFGSRPFSRIDDWLDRPIDWTGTLSNAGRDD